MDPETLPQYMYSALQNMVIIHIGRVDFVIPLLIVISLLWEVRMCLESYIYMYRAAIGWVARIFLHCYTASIFKIYTCNSCNGLLSASCPVLIIFSILNCCFSLSPYLTVNMFVYKNCFITYSTHLTHNTQPTNTVKVLHCPTLCNITKCTALFKVSQTFPA